MQGRIRSGQFRIVSFFESTLFGFANCSLRFPVPPPPLILIFLSTALFELLLELISFVQAPHLNLILFFLFLILPIAMVPPHALLSWWRPSTWFFFSILHHLALISFFYTTPPVPFPIFCLVCFASPFKLPEKMCYFKTSASACLLF